MNRILSIGGWAFSTDPSTYMIFREGVTPTNALGMAENIAKFVNDNDLDGVNIDWEYPGVCSFKNHSITRLCCIFVDVKISFQQGAGYPWYSSCQYQ